MMCGAASCSSMRRPRARREYTWFEAAVTCAKLVAVKRKEKNPKKETKKSQKKKKKEHMKNKKDELTVGIQLPVEFSPHRKK